MAESEKKQGRVGKFFKDLKSEFKKVTWPAKKETWRNSCIVIVELLIVGVAVALIDLGFTELFQWLASLV